jgi:hypothetical protein
METANICTTLARSAHHTPNKTIMAETIVQSLDIAVKNLEHKADELNKILKHIEPEIVKLTGKDVLTMSLSERIKLSKILINLVKSK